MTSSQPICTYSSCDVVVARKRTRCAIHETACDVQGCLRPRYQRQRWCSMHHARRLRHGELGGVSEVDRYHGIWKHNKDGYLWRHKKGGGSEFQHRLIMETVLGRPLFKEETVHHINGVRDDNRIENLELWSTYQPRGQRVSDKVTWALRILELYATFEATNTSYESNVKAS